MISANRIQGATLHNQVGIYELSYSPETMVLILSG